MKKTTATLVLGAFLMLGGVGVANAQNINPNPSPTSVCMKAATNKKITDLKAAKMAYIAALEQSRSNPDKVARKAAREQARKDFRTAQQSIKATFETDRKACQPVPVQ